MRVRESKSHRESDTEVEGNTFFLNRITVDQKHDNNCDSDENYNSNNIDKRNNNNNNNNNNNKNHDDNNDVNVRNNFGKKLG